MTKRDRTHDTFLNALAGVTMLCFGAAAATAQLVAPGPSGVSMGHLHLNAKDPVIQQQFWREVLGAQPGKMGPTDVWKLPGTLVIINKAAPSAGTDGSLIHHVALKVSDLKAKLAKAEAANIKVVEKSEKWAMILAPDDILVELVEQRTMTEPVAFGFYTNHVQEMKQWYVTTFGATAAKHGQTETADLPGVNLYFNPSDAALPGTKGRSLDHIGFEVKNLEDFTKKLEAAGVKFNIPYRRIPALGIAIAFFTDPWGTYIELTEGLDKI